MIDLTILAILYDDGAIEWHVSGIFNPLTIQHGVTLPGVSKK
ncbi:MAG: hypothetical protein OXE79_08105 [Acidimicrobiaceae bacterium]|nr:hypothetical protein [Acidimicrobiaceae bacterium]MCY4175738.1 hypothetical protein [Acidimicrobiaceae bacterium]MCY4279696.1 hypothetical protein [Acidimicrobiaceae bacterium]MCY4294557.1 hypothetical protein [Acidimicrobiaceae bacterium]